MNFNSVVIYKSDCLCHEIYHFIVCSTGGILEFGVSLDVLGTSLKMQRGPKEKKIAIKHEGKNYPQNLFQDSGGRL